MLKTMKPKKRQKLCVNCEGEIDLDVIVCPFCAADLREEKPEQVRASYHPKLYGQEPEQPASQSLYPPPYAEKAAPEPEKAAVEGSKNFFSPIALFTVGVQMVLLGLLMLFFSHKGIVTIKWDATYWFLYCLAGAPLLYFGYKNLS